MPHFFIDTVMEPREETIIRGRDAAHIAKVLRLDSGDWIVLSDGKGASYRASIIKASAREVVARIIERLPPRVGYTPPVLAHAVIKHDRTERIIQKAVELGIRELMPFHSQRTIPRFAAESGATRLDRWSRIAREAAQQSGLPWRPTVHRPQSFADLVSSTATFDDRILMWEGEQTTGISSIRDRLRIPNRKLVIIGPEGGFTEDEVGLARASSALIMSLGPQILRVETACLAALTVCQYELGAFDPQPAREEQRP